MRRLFGKQLAAYIEWKTTGKRPPQSERIGSRPGQRRTAVPRDEEYKAWIRTLPCCVCKRGPCDAAHTGTNYALSMKADDQTCVPLCRDCHTRGPLAYHVIGKRPFEKLHGLRFARIVAALRRQWREERAA